MQQLINKVEFAISGLAEDGLWPHSFKNLLPDKIDWNGSLPGSPRLVQNKNSSLRAGRQIIHYFRPQEE